ncbi:MAG: TolC family protein [Acidobacteria bacterium]|nr:TolC family protein [Acidobacteriota bacterium]
MRRVVIALSLVGLAADPAAAQSGAMLAGSVTEGEVRAEVLPLSLSDAVARGLRTNLGVLASAQQVELARGAEQRTRRELMPQVNGRIAESRQTNNLAAFGFNMSLFPSMSSLVGPFNIFDARIYASQQVVNLSARSDAQRAALVVDAAEFDREDTREWVVFTVTRLYLQAAASGERVATTRTQVATAEALSKMATDMRAAGTVPGIDVVRAGVQVQEQKQRLISAETEHRRLLLQLQRAIGVPVAQAVNLTDRSLVLSSPPMDIAAAVALAAEQRADYRAATTRLRAAEAALTTARREALPSLAVTADVGTIGTSASNALRTYAMAGAVRVPIFDVGRRGRVAESMAALKLRQAEAADFVQRLEADVQTAFLDLQAAEQQVTVVGERVALANQELALARTRFSAGVTSNLEVIQAQVAVATATDQQIASALGLNLARAHLMKVLGQTP